MTRHLMTGSKADAILSSCTDGDHMISIKKDNVSNLQASSIKDSINELHAVGQVK